MLDAQHRGAPREPRFQEFDELVESFQELGWRLGNGLPSGSQRTGIHQAGRIVVYVVPT